MHEGRAWPDGGRGDVWRPEGGIDSTALTVAFGLLSDHRRRRAIEILEANDGEMEIRRLADRLTIDNAAPRGAPSSSETPDDVLVSLMHVHLPKLANASVVEYDRERGTVALNECEQTTALCVTLRQCAFD